MRMLLHIVYQVRNTLVHVSCTGPYYRDWRSRQALAYFPTIRGLRTKVSVSACWRHGQATRADQCGAFRATLGFCVRPIDWTHATRWVPRLAAYPSNFGLPGVQKRKVEGEAWAVVANQYGGIFSLVRLSECYRAALCAGQQWLAVDMIVHDLLAGITHTGRTHIAGASFDLASQVAPSHTARVISQSACRGIGVSVAGLASCHVKCIKKLRVQPYSLTN